MRVRDDVGGGGKLTMDWKPARRVRRRLVPSNSATFTLSSSRRTCACSPPQATEEKEAHVTVRGDVNEDRDNDGAEKQSNKRRRKGARALRTT